MCESDTIPHRVIRPGGISPRALGPILTVTTRWPVGAVTPQKKGLAIKQGRSFLKQGLYVPDCHPQAMGWCRGQDNSATSFPTWKGLVTM
jgi:hypothetical protein